jgi:octaprenyl-diphosphate synthase
MSNSPLQPADSDLHHELQAVNQELEQALADLYTPLADLARSQLQRVQPLTRAAWVLTVAVGDPDDATLRQQRLFLAAAQEMLYIALSIHKLLLASPVAQQDDHQKTIMGGIILTGDYCFTRAAMLAAQTDHVQVVEIFSNALKAISEGLLRNLFADRSAAAQPAPAEALVGYDERRDLFVSGVQAAALLAALPAATTSVLAELAQVLHQPLTAAALATQAEKIQTIRPLSSRQQARLEAFFTWLATHSNGNSPTGV